MQSASFLSNGKLRFSYGSSGSDQLPNYGFLDTYTGTSAYQDVALMPVRLANPDFSWELTKKMDIALELSFFQNRIYSSVNYYKNQTSGQLVGFPLSGVTGFSSINANFPAIVENRGWEFELNTVNIKKPKLNWTTTFNLSVPRNKLMQ